MFEQYEISWIDKILIMIRDIDVVWLIVGFGFCLSIFLLGIIMNIKNRG